MDELLHRGREQRKRPSLDEAGCHEKGPHNIKQGSCREVERAVL